MNSSLDFDRVLAGWLQGWAPATAPDELVEGMLLKTARMRPLPAWRAALSVPVMRTQTRVLVGSPTMRLGWLAVALLLLGTLLVGGAIIGSHLIERPAPPAGSEVIVYTQSGGLYLATPDGPERTRLLLVPSGVRGAPVISPDGRHVAFLRDGAGPCGIELAIIDLATRRERSVATFWGRVDYIWSPTGDRLAYQSSECGKEVSPPAVPNGQRFDGGVFVFDLASGEERPLLEPLSGEQAAMVASEELSMLGWLSESDRLVVGQTWCIWDSAHGGCWPGRRVFSLPASGGAPAIHPAPEDVETPNQVTGWAVSPDGGRILLRTTHGLARGGIHYRLAVADANDCSVTTLECGPSQAIVEQGDGASWAPAGDLIVFMTWDIETPVDRDVHDDVREIWVTAPDGSGQQKVGAMRVRPFGLPTYPRWTPDGSRIYWSDSDGTWTVRADGTDLTMLPLPPEIEMDWRLGQ